MGGSEGKGVPPSLPREASAGAGREAAAPAAAPSFPSPLPRRRRALVEGPAPAPAPWPRGIPAAPAAVAFLAATSAAAVAPLRPPPPATIPPGLPGRGAIFRPSAENDGPPPAAESSPPPPLAAGEARAVRFIQIKTGDEVKGKQGDERGMPQDFVSENNPEFRRREHVHATINQAGKAAKTGRGRGAEVMLRNSKTC